MEIILASHNKHKKEEFEKIFPDFIELKSLSDVGMYNDIAETGSTFHENAFIKAKAGYDFCKKPCFADDSGLVIPSLNGEPGIYSNRYAETGNQSDNVAMVLQKLANIEDRSAYFICVICYYDGKEIQYFEGKVHGTISQNVLGKNGFGYDPIFIPKGYAESFAEMQTVEKNAISHRSKAVAVFLSLITQTLQ